MKTVGIIGGVGPESTIDYYRSMIAIYRQESKDGSSPSIVINSIDMRKAVALFEANDLSGVADYLVAEVGRLAGAGADFGLLSANTPHIVFDEVQRRSPIPLISIVQATCDAAKARGLKRLGLFGTRFTMQGRFYQEVFSKEGIALSVPEPDEQDYIHDKYMGELVKGVFLPETRAGLLAIVDRLVEREKIEGVILGGTELPLILRDTEHRGIPFLDTTQIHVKAAVARLLQ
jgi:aspartate racemase